MKDHVKKKTIAMFLDKDFPPDIRVEKEIHTLMAAGFDVKLFALSYEKKEQKDQERGIAIYRFFGNKLLYKLSALSFTIPLFHIIIYWKISGFIKIFRPDYLHVHDMIIAPSILKVSEKLKIPMILDLHENRPAIMELYAHVNQFPGKYLINLKAWKRAQIKLETKADRLILVTEEAKQYAIESEGINQKKVYVVPNTVKRNFAVDQIDSKDIEEKFKDKFCVLYFGDTALRRGTDTIIEAVSILKNKIESIHAILVGNGSEDHHLVQLSKKLGIENLISFEGWRDAKLLKAYTNSSAIGLCPFKRNLHHDTTFANKLFQFMGLGLPLIVSNCPSQVNVIKNHNCGLVFEAGNAYDLADKILNLYKDKDLRLRLGENGEKAIMQDLHWEITSKSLIDLYNSFEN